MLYKRLFLLFLIMPTQLLISSNNNLPVLLNILILAGLQGIKQEPTITTQSPQEKEPYARKPNRYKIYNKRIQYPRKGIKKSHNYR